MNNKPPRVPNWRIVILALWLLWMGCVITGSLLSAASPEIAALGRLHINDKVMHFSAYLALSLLPVVGFADRRRGIRAAAGDLLPRLL